ncbi:Uroporphyrinogen-III synthase [Cryptotermes secundus]|uniref:Uroporphyrinogen-III synthase n=1 Tax=Cryptotermes secundus TaxID=105785 RepID=A0A2J7QDT8_9NEOP|nr:Uroporphyrinogen-III synthase [Cryptotermes secundus]
MKTIKGEVLIFKALTNDTDGQEDPFKIKLEEAGIHTQNVTVLDFEYCNLNVLQQNIEKPDMFSGLVFTSPRAVRAVACIKDARRLLGGWKKHPVFVVGEGTSKILQKELCLDGEGSNAGNSSALAEIILQNKFEHPLLFPCGNLTGDELSTKLSTREIVAYFSPSGMKFTIPVLEKMEVPLQQLKFVAIGPTTEAALLEHKLKVWSVASKPTPEHLLEAILK